MEDKEQGPGRVVNAEPGNGYLVATDDGARKVVHATHLRQFIARLNTVGVVFDNEQSFGQLVPCPSSQDFKPEVDSRFDELDPSHLSETQRDELRMKAQSPKLEEQGKPRVKVGHQRRRRCKWITWTWCAPWRV